MASAKKQIHQLSRQFYKLSVVDGAVSPERVAGVLAYIEQHNPHHAIAILKAYHHLVAAAIARNRAVVEHAGPIADGTLEAIAAAMTKKYNRPVTAVAQRNDALLAGLRVRVGDDTFESSVAAQLAELSAAV